MQVEAQASSSHAASSHKHEDESSDDGLFDQRPKKIVRQYVDPDTIAKYHEALLNPVPNCKIEQEPEHKTAHVKSKETCDDDEREWILEGFE